MCLSLKMHVKFISVVSYLFNLFASVKNKQEPKNSSIVLFDLYALGMVYFSSLFLKRALKVAKTMCVLCAGVVFQRSGTRRRGRRCFCGNVVYFPRKW